MFESRFGILLLIKIGLYLTMVGSALVAVFILGPRMRKRRGAAAGITAEDMTPAELAQCDGQEGRPAYFAYKGTIYRNNFV